MVGEGDWRGEDAGEAAAAGSSVGAGQCRQAPARNCRWGAAAGSSAAALGCGVCWGAWGWSPCVLRLKTAFSNTSVPRPTVTAVVPVILDMLILCSRMISKRSTARGGTQARAALSPIGVLCGDSGETSAHSGCGRAGAWSAHATPSGLRPLGACDNRSLESCGLCAAAVEPHREPAAHGLPAARRFYRRGTGDRAGAYGGTFFGSGA